MHRTAPAALFAAALAVAPAAGLAQDSPPLADVTATAAQSCDTGIGSLEGFISAPEGVSADKVEEARGHLASAKSARTSGDYARCFDELEAGLALMGQDPMALTIEGTPGN